MGTPEFAVPIFESLVKSLDYEVVAIITQPDRPAGRSQRPTPPPVKTAAAKHRIPVLQPERLRKPEVAVEIKELNPDIIIVAAYGQIIPKAILEIPRFGAVNVHPSLLPKYRGASPIQAAIKNGDAVTGVTIMLLDEQLDHGPILADRAVAIAPTDTAGTLSERLAQTGAALLMETLPRYVKGKLTPREQDHAAATVVKQLTRDDGRIDWSCPAAEIERTIRAYDPWPGSWSAWNEIRLKIIRAKISSEAPEWLKAGSIFQTGDGMGLAVRCGSGSIVLDALQPEGKKEMTAAEFLRGHADFLGSTLTEKRIDHK